MFSPHETSWDICFLLLHVRCFCPSKLGIPFAYSVTYIYTYIYGYVCVCPAKKMEGKHQTTLGSTAKIQLSLNTEDSISSKFLPSIGWSTQLLWARDHWQILQQGIGGVLDWMIGWLADWLVHCLADWLVDCLLSGLRSLRIIDIERLIEGLTDWCTHGWMDRWMDQLFGLLAGQLIDWIDWCAEFHRHSACIFQEPFLKCYVHSTCCQDMW